MKKIIASLRGLSLFETCLWISSVLFIIASYLFIEEKSTLTLISSIIGATALIFVAKGYVLGQILTLVFAVVYGIISYGYSYFGEMITYLGMTAPIAVVSIISWVRHPYRDTSEVEIGKISKKQILILLILTVEVTVAFYFILGYIENSNLIVSTVSVATSFLASYLLFLRSPYYALAYAANDIVLITLWVLATIDNSEYFPMIVCFAVFLVNDMYGFINWRHIYKRQSEM